MKSLKKILLLKALTISICTELFSFDISKNYISNIKDNKLFQKQIDGLSNEEQDIFMLGRSFFTIPWVEAPSATTARDGLGPLFNANSCISCHPKNGRAEILNSNGFASRGLIARLSIDSNDSKYASILKKKGFIQEPTYGEQLAINGVFNVPFEGNIEVDFEYFDIKLSDGEIVNLRRPKYSLKNLNYGELHKDSVVSYRVAQSLHGMGLIDLIPDEEILKNQDIDDKNSDGISGKANFVYSPISQKYELGRYTHKASVSKLKEQIANAFSNDIGVTTTLIPYEKCTDFQKECQDAPKAKDAIDLPNDRLDAVTFYIKSLKSYSANKNSQKYKKGYEIFERLECSKCHISSFNTKLGFEIRPFSDFLLHDMGEDLADGRVEFMAEKSEWRTAPLWGIAINKLINKNPNFLHDGRARSVQEAILWHDGEAKASKEAYINLSKEDRLKLIKFIEEL
ncbi:di-heme oxidoredictase family protein [Aliarcobacter skirrowii]|uniref:di-heme oxidoreductase family protein n=1 Tax=Aliarcobacter skirrowii TaxID=28200 RepID=UPI0029B5622A|nr:di-heme oxidoredictase family protein [Aliarcobacter skirrowii]MDX4026735.1 di-heme oxidoredictase family protein [Aliarcobacter skirrowii]